MRSWTKHIVISLLSLLLGLPLCAQQLSGVVIDAETGEPIPYASVVYRGHNVAKVSDINGQFSIDRHAGWNLTFSAVGYKDHIMAISEKTKNGLKIALKLYETRH